VHSIELSCFCYSDRTDNEPLEFVEAMAANEKLYITTHARPRMNYHRSLIESELPDEVLDLLNRYLRLSPAMVPPLGTVDTHYPHFGTQTFILTMFLSTRTRRELPV
jgi:hypothetical protein